METINLKKFHWKDINWKHKKYWLKETIKDLPSLIWFFISMHYIGIIAFGISLYFYPYKFMQTNDFINVIAGGAILFLGVGYDINRHNRIM
jgi:hypothetical protein